MNIVCSDQKHTGYSGHLIGYQNPMKNLEETLEIIVQPPHFTDANTEMQGRKAS